MEIKQIQIKFLPPTFIKFYNVITMVGEDWNRFSAFLPYFRNFDRVQYQNSRVVPDEIDTAILNSIKETYPKSYWQGELLMFEGQLADRLAIIEGGTRLKFRVDLIPNLPDPEIFMKEHLEYFGYYYELNLRVHLGPESERLKHIFPYAMCHLNRDLIEEKKATIIPVQ